MAFCIRYLESHNNDVESLKKEIKRRGAYGIPISISQAEERNWMDRARMNSVDTVLILSLITLHDEFKFGTKRLNRFKERMNLKAECLAEDYTTWDDQIKILADECGLDLSIRWLGEDPTKKEGH